MYDFEVEIRNIGWGDLALVHDPERGRFLLHDGCFAFSHEHAD